MTLHCGFFGQLSELRGEVSRLQAEKEELERELDTQSNHTHKQVQEHALTVCVCLYVCTYLCALTSVCICVILGINAPVSGPGFRVSPPGFAEIFQPVTECSPEPAGE